ncbi:MAG: response regulator [Thiohalophilus sp.]|jgi:DNA-binding response OmpR family regulator
MTILRELNSFNQVVVYMGTVRPNHQGTLLILEKDAHTAYLLDYLLSREGYNVISATDCKTATRLLAKIPPASMIFLDVAFIEDGHCLFMDTLEGIPGWRDTPILLLAEHYTMEDVFCGLKAGANDYIVQPFNHAELLTQIKRYSLKQPLA